MKKNIRKMYKTSGPSRGERLLERGKDGVKTLGFTASAIGNIGQAVFGALEALGKWDSKEAKQAWIDTKDAGKDALKAVDKLSSTVIGTSRELLGGVLNGVSWACDKVTQVEEKKTWYGKTRKHLSNRVINTIDAGINITGGTILAGADLVDDTISATVDSMTSRKSKRVGSLVDNYGIALKQILLSEFAIDGVYKGLIRGHSTYRPNRFDYGSGRYTNLG